MKRILSLVLVLVMVLGMIPMASATETTPGVTLTTDKPSYTAGDQMTLTLTAPNGYTIDPSSISGSESWLAGWQEVEGSNGKSYKITLTTALPSTGTAYQYSVTCNLNPVEGTEGTAVTGASSGNVSHNVYSAGSEAVITLTGPAACKTNQAVTLTAEVGPATLQDKSVSYSVSPTDGASVSSTGVFTATKANTYTITATSNGKTDTHEIVVTASDYVVSCSGVTVYPGQTNVSVPAVTVKKGTAALTAGTDFTVTWGSGVTDGKINAMTASGTVSGTVAITENGETYPVSFAVTVVKPVVTCQNASAQVGTTATLTPSITTGYTVEPEVEFVYPSDLTVASDKKSASVRSTTVGITTYTIDAKIDGKTGVAEPAKPKVSFYDSYEIEVTMKSEMTGFKFTDTGIFESVVVDGISKSRPNVYSLSMLLSYTNSYASVLEQYDATSTVGNITYVDSTLTSLKFNPATENSYVNLQLGGLKFSCLRDGEFVLLFKSTTQDGLIVASGWIDMTVKAGGGDLVYNTTFGKEIQFTAKDFTNLWTKAGKSGSPSYVIFGDQPTYGDLYTTKAMTSKATTSQKFYFGTTGTYLFNEATYMPMKNIKVAHEDEIPFTMYGSSTTDNVSGVITIKVGQNNPFTDVKESDYFYDAVMWAVEKEITTGTSATTFSPSQVCTRGQVVTFLWRAAGEPAARTTVNPFSDVKKTDYFYDAVLWAYEKGITTGITATTFGPNQAITRSQAVTFLYRYNNEPTVTGTNSFVDVSSTAYYDDAVTWAVKNGITNGMSATKFAPNDGCTRAQIVTFLYRDAV